jgi:hypothetical protein
MAYNPSPRLTHCFIHVFKKPTTDITVHSKLYLPYKHKIYLIQRLNIYPNPANKKKKKQILNNNQYEIQTYDKIMAKLIKPKGNNAEENAGTRKNVIIFTYVGRKTRIIAKFFKNTKMKIAFKHLIQLKTWKNRQQVQKSRLI